jgi:hypothetical protein
LVPDSSVEFGGLAQNLIAPIAGLVGVVVGSLLVLAGQARERRERRVDRLLGAYSEWMAAAARLNQEDLRGLHLRGMAIDPLADEWIKQNMVLVMQQATQEHLRIRTQEVEAFQRIILLDFGSPEASEANRVRRLLPWEQVRARVGDVPRPDQVKPALDVFDVAEREYAIAVGKFAAQIAARLGTLGRERG